MAFPSGSHVSLRSSVFAATADARYRGELTLVQIDLAAFGVSAARTLRLATAASSSGRSYVDPDGNVWQPILAGEPSIDHGGSWLALNWQAGDATVPILDMRLDGPGSDRLSDLFTSYQPIGARVTIYQVFDNLASTSEFATVFYGEVAWVDGLEHLDGFELHCVQSRGWVNQFPPRVVNIDDFPEAPKGVIGTAIPIILGDWSNRHRYLQVADVDATTYETYLAGIAHGHAPMLPVETPTGTGIAAPRAIISGDEIDQGVLPGGAPYDQWYMHEPALDCVVGGSVGLLSNPAGGPADLTLAAPPQVTGAVIPIEAHGSNTALYVEELFRRDKPRNLAGAAYLDFNANKKILRVYMPQVSPLGVFVSAALWCFYKYNGTGGTAPTLKLVNELYSGADTTNFPTASTGPGATGFEAVKPLTIVNALTSSVPSYDPWGQISNCYAEVIVKAAGQAMYAHRVVLLVTYKPAARIERPGVQRASASGPRVNVAGRTQSGARMFQGSVDTSSPDLVSFDAPLLNFPRGPKDTAAGIYTGTPDALIQHPVDMVRYLLRYHAGVSSGEIVENAGDFGAFPDAKATLSSYTFRALFSARDDIDKHIEQIAAESLCWFKRCPTLPGAPFVAVPWEMGSPVNYRSTSEPFVFYRARNHVVESSIKVGFTGISGVSNIVRVNYDWDPRTNTYGDQLYITPTGSRVAVTNDLFTVDSTREAEAASSATLYGEKETVLSLKMVTLATTAYRTLARFFDLRVSPRLTLKFRTFVNAYDLNRGHVIALASDWDDRLAFPRAGSDGSWEGKLFRVVNVKRLAESPVEYEVAAVEI